jgi:hypothetical protein
VEARGRCSAIVFSGSSEEFMGKFRLRKFAK